MKRFALCLILLAIASALHAATTEPASQPQHGEPLLSDLFLRPAQPADHFEANPLWAMPLPDGRLRISPLRQWSETGIELREGQQLEIRADGTVQGGWSNEDWADGPWGPAGGPAKDAPEMRVCALICRIESASGEKTEFIVGPHFRGQLTFGGRLLLGVSDVNHQDNSGEFVVSITLDGKPATLDSTVPSIATANLSPSMQPINGVVVEEVNGARRLSAAVREADRPMLVTQEFFRPPLEIRARALTDSTNIRLYYGHFGWGQLIFNWEVREDELRVHSPATGNAEGVAGEGDLEKGKFHDFVWRIGPKQMQVLVDGEERYKADGDFSAIASAIGIGPAWGSHVDVESLVVAPLDPTIVGQPVDDGKSRDYLLGWWVRQSGKHQTFIPVLKHGEEYFSVCRGAEAPLKKCRGGLQWALTPSSMEGTKISSGCIRIFDSNAQTEGGGTLEGEPDELTKVPPPEGLLDATAEPPRSNDDFVGWYQPVYFPYFRYELRKANGKFVIAGQMYEPHWTNMEAPREIKPLPDQLGFGGIERTDDDEQNALTYNVVLKRYEMVVTSSKRNPASIRMPLARIPAPPSPEAGEAPPKIDIGIPSWH